MYGSKLQGTPYTWWGRSVSKLDCSGLLTYFGYLLWVRTQQETVTINSTKLYQMSKYRIPITHLRVWDIIYFDNKDGDVNHIAVVSEKFKNNTIGILDASLANGVSIRTIEIKKLWWHRHYIVDGERYRLYGASNPVYDEAVRKGIAVVGANDKPTKCEVKAEKVVLNNYENRQEYHVTSYLPWLGWINCWGGGCWHTADWTPTLDEYAGKIIACPRQFPSWTMVEIEGLGTMRCADTWWHIVLKGDTNSKCNESTMNRLDIFVWYKEVMFPFASSRKYNARVVSWGK